MTKMRVARIVYHLGIPLVGLVLLAASLDDVMRLAGLDSLDKEGLRLAAAVVFGGQLAVERAHSGLRRPYVWFNGVYSTDHELRYTREQRVPRFAKGPFDSGPSTELIDVPVSRDITTWSFRITNDGDASQATARIAKVTPNIRLKDPDAALSLTGGQREPFFHMPGGGHQESVDLFVQDRRQPSRISVTWWYGEESVELAPGEYEFDIRVAAGSRPATGRIRVALSESYTLTLEQLDGGKGGWLKRLFA